MLEAGRTPAEIFAAWENELQHFRAISAPYHLYP
jgi:hypothetical protein